MTDKSPAPSAPDSDRTPTQDAVELVQAMGQSLNMALLYGAAHKVALSAFDRSYPVLEVFLKRYGPLHLSIVEGELLLNGNSAGEAPLSGNLISRLTALNLLSMVIDTGLSPDEYRKLLALLLTPAGKLPTSGSASDLMSAAGFQHIQAQNVVYRRVDDSAVEPEKTPEPPPIETPPAPPDLDNVLAFLKNDPKADEQCARKELRELAADAEKLADLILRTADVRAQAAELSSGESLTDLVVGCINRVTGALLETPSSETQKGRKQVKRTLLLLEKSLLARLQTLAGDASTPAAVSSAIEDAAEELDAAALAAKYMKTRRAAEATKAKLERLIDRTDQDSNLGHELHDHLMEHGLSPEGWQELVVARESVAPATAAPGAEFQDIKALAVLLARLGETLQHSKGQPAATTDAELHTLVTEAGKQVSVMAAGTEKKIASLRKLAESPDGPLALSRKALVQTLAEIAQELSQPLTIMNATLDMLRGQRPGPLTAAQGEVLALAAESGSRLAHLVNCLMRLAGTPTALQPDRTILDAAYALGTTP